jgi:HSP20 family protein
MTTLQRFDPFTEFDRLNSLMDQVIGTARTAPHPLLPIDILEEDGSLIIQAAAPGVGPDALDVSIDGGILTIRASRAGSDKEDGKVYRREITRGEISRSLRLPEGLDLGSVTAELENGLATIRIPRAIPPESQPIRVPIQARA